VSFSNCFFNSSERKNKLRWQLSTNQKSSDLPVAAVFVKQSRVAQDSQAAANMRHPSAIVSNYQSRGTGSCVTPACSSSRGGGTCPRRRPSTGTTWWTRGMGPGSRTFPDTNLRLRIRNNLRKSDENVFRRKEKRQRTAMAAVAARCQTSLTSAIGAGGQLVVE